MARQFSSARDPYAAREARTQQLLREAASTACPIRCRRLREEAAALNVDMALGVARPYHGRGIEDDDIDQVAFLGLWKAVLGFTSESVGNESPLDSDRSDDAAASEDMELPGAEHLGEATEDEEPAAPRRFAAYAIPTITGEVKRHFRDHGWLVRPPRKVQEQTLAINHAVTTLRQDLGHEPRDDELVGLLGISNQELDQARQARHGYYAQSLDTPLHPAGTTTLKDTVPDGNDVFTLIDTTLTLRWAMDQLSDAERELLAMRYGEGLTQADIGSVLGVSQMQVSRLLTRIHRRLRDSLIQEAS